MARRPPPPPPPPADDDAGPRRVGNKRPTPAAIEAGLLPGSPDRVRFNLSLKYGLDNYGNVGFGVGYDSDMKPQDGGDITNTFDRVYDELIRDFHKRDREVRAALGKRISDPSPKEK